MRNFKKFLALVLAMLMVSACAVSVSAYQFADQDAIVAADVNDAVNALADLGVIKGREDGKFYPNDTLTREEACVIFAKLRAGSEGQKYEWLEETTVFPDVTAKWSFAYINYAFRNGFMTGDGTNFNPKGVLTIEQALCAAVKAYKGNGTAEDPSGIARYAKRVEAVGEHAYWAGHYTDIAVELGLTENVPFNYTAPCARGTMAQIAYNLLKEDASIAKGFGFSEIKGALTVVANDTVTVDGVKIVRSVFEDALADNGFEGALTDYIGAEFLIKYDATTGAVYSAALKSGMLVFDFNDVILSINTKDNKNLNTITLAGKTYRANGLGDNGGSGLIGGAGKYPEISVEYVGARLASELEENGDGILNNLPTYYKAFAYDDDNNGEYDRLIVKEYKLASIKANTADAKDGVAFDTVKFMNLDAFTNKGLNDDKAKIEYTGVTAVIDDETPNLVNVAYNEGANTYVVDVLETAVTKTGIVSGITAGKALKIGGETVAYNAEFVEPAYATLNQNTTVFTVDGKFVKVANVSSSSKTLMIETVKIDANGNAVVTGYNVNNRFAKEEITVVGLADTKLVPMGAFRVAEENKPAQEVYLATKKDATTKNYISDGKYYNFTITDKGAYLSADAVADIDTLFAGAVTYENLSVSNYVKYGETPVAKHNVDAPAVVKIIIDTEAAKKDVYDEVKYAVSETLSKVEKVNAVFLKDAKTAISGSDKVKVVIISAASIDGDVIIANPLAASETIVQVIAAAHEIGFDYNTYEAVDLLNGTKVNVTGEAVVGGYYVADANYKLGAQLDDKWVLNNDLSAITVTYDGSILPTVSAFPTQLKKGINENDDKYAPVVATTDKKVFSTIDQITIFAADGEKNVITLKDGAPVTLKASDVLEVGQDLNVKSGFTYTTDKEVITFTSVDSYVVGSTMILVMDIDKTAIEADAE